MRLRSDFLSHSAVVAVWVACCALLLTGCDSNGSSGSGTSSSGDTGTFEVTVKNVGSPRPILKSGAFTPDDVINDNNNVPPLEPGEAFEFSFTAGPNEIPGSGMRLSVASMFVQSNDGYYAFEPEGIALFDDNGNPIGQSSPANVTSDLNLYDAGTEQDQEPGTGGAQAPRQANVGDGTDENGTISRIQTNSNGTLEDDGFTYPDISNSVKMTVSSEAADNGGYEFTVTMENVGGGDQVNGEPLLLSPGSYAVHWDQKPNGDDVTYPGHAPGAAASDGIERIAEDGKPNGVSGAPGDHVQTLQGITGVTVPFSPGAYAVHSDEVSFFQTGSSASGGIEDIAEDGKPGNLVSTLKGSDGIKSVGAFNTPEGSDSKGPLTPGNSYTFSVDAGPGDRLSLATMYIQSNDLFYAFKPDGIALYDSDDNPISGEQTVMLYDAGTEADQEPGVGLDQAPRQSSLDSGPSGEGSVVQVGNNNDGFSYPSPSSLIKVTVTPQ